MPEQFVFKEYEGWENKFTWALSLHLRNEQELYTWAEGIAQRSNTDFAAGEHLREAVRLMLDWWIIDGKHHEAELLVSQLTGDAIAFTEWGDVVKSLSGMENQVLVVGNPFTDGIVVYYMLHPTQRQQLLEVFEKAAERKRLLNKHPEWVEDMNTGRPKHEILVDKILEVFSGGSPFWAGVDIVKEYVETLNQDWIEDPQRRKDEVYTNFAKMLLARSLEVVNWEHVAEGFREDERADE